MLSIEAQRRRLNVRERCIMSVAEGRFIAAGTAMPHTRNIAKTGTVIGATLAFDIVSGDQWDRTISQFDDVCSEQSYAFSAGRWPQFKHEGLLFKRGDTVVGGAMMLIRHLPLGLGAIAVGKWTPMLRDRHSDCAPLNYRAIIETLVAEYATRRGMILSLMPHVDPTGDTSDEQTLRTRGFIPAANLAFPMRYIVGLQLPDEMHRKALHPKWRYHLAHSEKAGLEFEAAGPEAFAEFDALYRSMCDRKRFPDYSAFATIPDLLALEDEALRPRIFLVRRDGKIVAGAVIFPAGETAVYLYGATNEDALPLRAGYFMHWHIVRWLKENTRAKWYDLGGSDGFSGLHQFKKSFVGKAGATVPMPALHHYAANRLRLKFGIGVFALRDLLISIRYRYLGGNRGLAKPDLVPSRPPEVS
jgi:hypothetical protein